jgi:dTMP kinase
MTAPKPDRVGECTPPRRSLRRGVLITFEGPDGSGKSTAAAACQEHLESEGYGPVALFREPGQSEAGQRIRQLSKRGRDAISPEEEIELFIEDRKWDLETNIRPVLEQRGIVLLDRYYHSSIAYQGALCGDPAMVRRRNEAFAIRPDLVILMRLSIDRCLDRIQTVRGGDPDLFERRESLARVIDVFDRMEDHEIVRIDAEKSREVVQSQIHAAVSDLLLSHQI